MNLGRVMRLPIGRRGLGALAAGLLLGFAGCSVLDPDPRATIDNTAGSTDQTTGAAIYLRECASCHGTDGAPLTSTAKDLRGYQGTFEDLDTALTVGPSGMPQFPQIDNSARHRLYDHIRTFPPN